MQPVRTPLLKSVLHLLIGAIGVIFIPINASYAQCASPGFVQASDGTSCNSVTITWSSVQFATGYQIFRNPFGGTGGTQIGTNGSSTSFTDTTGTPGVTYWYSVRATGNICGSNAPFGGPDSGFRAGPPAVPSNVQASNGSSCSGVSVSWSSVVGATGHEVGRATSQGGSPSVIGSTSGVSFTDTTAVPGQVYFYSVRALNNCGAGNFSSGSAQGVRLAPPPPPIGGPNVQSTCASITVSWSAVLGASGYDVGRSTSFSGSNPTVVGSPSGGSFTDTTAIRGTTYYYFVRSRNSCGAGDFGSSSSGIVRPALGVPAFVSAREGTSCDFTTVQWNFVLGATRYDVARYEFNQPSFATVIGSSISTSFNDNTGIPGRVYYYFVRAVDNCGPGDYSSTPPVTGFRATSPVVTDQPAGVSVCTSNAIAFSVRATGNGIAASSIDYQWQLADPPGNWISLNSAPVALPGGGQVSATQADQRLAYISVSGRSGTLPIRCIVSNACGSVTSNTATLTVLEACCDPIDFNQNSLFPEDQDLVDFLSVLAGGDCSPGNTCSDIDFNNDGLFPDDTDLIAFLTVLAGGAC